MSTELPFRTSTPPRLAERGMHRLVDAEVWFDAKAGRVAVIGVPVEFRDESDERAHNCDEMGCASVGGHNLIWAAVTRPFSLSACAPGEPEQPREAEG